MSDELKYFKTYRISNPPIFDCLLYVRRDNVAGNSLRHWPNTFVGWSWDRVEGFISACKNGRIELIEHSNTELTSHMERKALKSMGLTPMQVQYDEYYQGRTITENHWSEAQKEPQTKKVIPTTSEPKKVEIAIQGSLF